MLMQQRAAGILLHPTSLYNHYPIGDLGPAALAFVDFLAASGQTFWQMLPIGPTTTKDNSPYQLTSAFAGNPLLISPDKLRQQGLLRRCDLELTTTDDWGRVDYVQAASLKQQWLKQAFSNFTKKLSSKHQTEFTDFMQAQAYWLDDFALFLALQEHLGTPDWTQWDLVYRRREPKTMIGARQELADIIRYHQFVQWQFALQWQELQAYCQAKKIKLIGDVPLFVAHLSADVWANPELFKLDPSGKPLVFAGAAADHFSRSGQIWETPVYQWQNLKAQNYAWWVRRLQMAAARFDINRLDHFIGFVRSYEVTAGAKLATHGHYRLGPGVALFKKIYEMLGSVAFIAEDLGAVTPKVTAMLEELGIAGMWVFELMPHLTPKINAVAYTSTHDTDTILGWYRKLTKAQRLVWQKKLKVAESGMVWAIINQVMASNAHTAIMSLQDLLELGAEARMNIPGTAAGNWRWRLSDQVLTAALTQKLHNLTKACER